MLQSVGSSIGSFDCIEQEKLDLCRRCCGGEQSKGPFCSREPEESVELAILLLVFWVLNC